MDAVRAAEVLGPSDPLPGRPRRILVGGASGSGKTTVCAAIAQTLNLPYTEIDGLYHGPGWVPRETFVAEVTAIAGSPSWVIEWQYSVVRDLLADRADVMVWLDLSRSQVLWQVTRRTLRRRLGRMPLWNGNVEPPLRTILTDPDHIIRWSWRSYVRVAPRMALLQERRPDLPVVRLRSRRDVRRWLDGLAGPT